MIEETKLRFESFDKFNGLLDISEQSNLERIYYEQKHAHQYRNLK